MIGGADNLKSNFSGCYDNALLLLRSIYSGNEVKNSRLFANRPPALKKYKNWCSVLKNHFYGIIKRTWTQKQEEKRCFWFLVIGIGTTFPNIKIWTVHNFAINTNTSSTRVIIMFRFTQIQSKKIIKTAQFVSKYNLFSTMPRTATIETTMGTFKVELYTEVIEISGSDQCTMQ